MDALAKTDDCPLCAERERERENADIEAKLLALLARGDEKREGERQQ